MRLSPALLSTLALAAAAGLSLIGASFAARAVEDGADEVDMVIDVGAAKMGDFEAVKLDIRTVRDAIPNAVLKVIIESAALTDDEIRGVCEAAVDAGADFVKTSTGFHPSGGASAHAVRLMRECVGPNLGVKASGGIRDTKTAEAMIAAGASRIGASNRWASNPAGAASTAPTERRPTASRDHTGTPFASVRKCGARPVPRPAAGQSFRRTTSFPSHIAVDAGACARSP